MKKEGRNKGYAKSDNKIMLFIQCTSCDYYSLHNYSTVIDKGMDKGTYKELIRYNL